MTNQGDSLVEVVVAVAIISVVVLALIRVTTLAVNNATFAKNQATATNYARESLEDARQLKEVLGDSTFFAPAGLSQCNKIDTVGSFSRRRTCSLTGSPPLLDSLMEITVVVSWDSHAHQSRLETTLAKWK
jgi:Tfp pilus assembly protein PilV